MALKDIAPVLAKDFVGLKIDTDRMKNGNDLFMRYAKTQQGIPWFVFLDGDGSPLITGMAPDKGNVGFPAQDWEIAHFQVMLEKVAKRITRADIDLLAKSLVAFRDVKLPPRQRGCLFARMSPGPVGAGRQHAPWLTLSSYGRLVYPAEWFLNPTEIEES